MRYRKILVAVDGSESSKNAFRQSCKVARADKSWITVITVVPRFDDIYDPRNVRNKIDAVLRGEGEKIISEIGYMASQEGISIKTRMETGNPFEVIVDVLDAEGYDLVVMGRRGTSRLDRVLTGSVTARVIGHTGKDVLVVPEDASMGWARILLPTDGSKYSDAAAARSVALAGSYKGDLFAVSVVDVTEEFHANAPEAVERLVHKAKAVLEGVREKAEAEGVKAETFVKEGEAYQAITGLASELGATLIVMGSHGRTGLIRLLMGSVTEKVIGHSPCPVLVVRS